MTSKKALTTCRKQAPKGTLEPAWKLMMGSVAFAGPLHNILFGLYCGVFASYFNWDSKNPSIVHAWDTLHLISCLAELPSVTAHELSVANNSVVATREQCVKANAHAQTLTDQLAKV